MTMPCGSWTTILPREKAPLRHDDPDRVGPLADEPLDGDGLLEPGVDAELRLLVSDVEASPLDDDGCTLADVAEWIVPDAQLLPADEMLGCALDRECAIPDAQLLPDVGELCEDTLLLGCNPLLPDEGDDGELCDDALDGLDVPLELAVVTQPWP